MLLASRAQDIVILTPRPVHLIIAMWNHLLTTELWVWMVRDFLSSVYNMQTQLSELVQIIWEGDAMSSWDLQAIYVNVSMPMQIKAEGMRVGKHDVVWRVSARLGNSWVRVPCKRSLWQLGPCSGSQYVWPLVSWKQTGEIGRALA